METDVNGNGNENQQPTSGGIKNHFNKHKWKYLFGAGVLLAMGVGYHIGNRGNSKHHYARLLRDGVQSAVENGVKEVVDRGMTDIVKDGMEDVVTDVMTDVVNNTIGETVARSVKRAIKDSAVTIIKEVETVKHKELADTSAEDFKKALDYVTNGLNGIKLRVDENGNVYVAKHTV